MQMDTFDKIDLKLGCRSLSLFDLATVLICNRCSLRYLSI
jgi:hypothetical protein